MHNFSNILKVVCGMTETTSLSWNETICHMHFLLKDSLNILSRRFQFFSLLVPFMSLCLCTMCFCTYVMTDFVRTYFSSSVSSPGEHIIYVPFTLNMFSTEKADIVIKSTFYPSLHLFFINSRILHAKTSITLHLLCVWCSGATTSNLYKLGLALLSFLHKNLEIETYGFLCLPKNAGNTSCRDGSH